MRLFKGLTLVAAMATVCVAPARATVVVDAFTISQLTTLTGVGISSNTASGAGILGGTRTQTVSLDVVPPFAAGVASAGSPSGVFSGSFTGVNSPVGGSYFDLSYKTSAINAAAGNDGIYFTASSQAGSVVTITANGTSTATVTVPDGVGFSNYFVSLASFTNPSVFSALTSLDIKAVFPNVSGSGPSLTFTGPILISAIPEPSVLALSSVAFLALGSLRLRRKS